METTLCHPYSHERGWIVPLERDFWQGNRKRRLLPRLRGGATTAPAAVLPMNERGQNRVKNIVKAPARVFRQKSQDKATVLLEKGVLPPVPPIGLGVREMLRHPTQ